MKVNIGANVSSRAEKIFSALVEDFKVKQPKTKVKSFHYEIRHSEDVWSFRYLLQKSWISKIYKLQVSYSFPINMDDEEIMWDHYKKQWKSKNKEITSLNSTLNDYTELKSLIRTVDFEQVNIVISDQRLTVNLIPFPGCFIWTMIPPMHYFVKLKGEEYAAMEKILAIVKASCKALEGQSGSTWQSLLSEEVVLPTT